MIQCCIALINYFLPFLSPSLPSFLPPFLLCFSLPLIPMVELWFNPSITSLWLGMSSAIFVLFLLGFLVSPFFALSLTYFLTWYILWYILFHFFCDLHLRYKQCQEILFSYLTCYSASIFCDLRRVAQLNFSCFLSQNSPYSPLLRRTGGERGPGWPWVTLEIMVGWGICKWEEVRGKVKCHIIFPQDMRPFLVISNILWWMAWP